MKRMSEWKMKRLRILVCGIACVVMTVGAIGCGEPERGASSTDGDGDGDGDGEYTYEVACEEACDRVYNECHQVFFTDDNVAISEEQCVDACIDDDLLFGGAECVAHEAECESIPEDMVSECLDDEYHPDACDHLDAWPHEWVTMEDEVLELVNDLRATGTECPIDGEMSPVGPVESEMHLRCAARLHSKDMNDRNYFDHHDPDGVGPAERATSAGFTGGGVAENIAQGYTTPQAVVEGWRTSTTGHCENMLNGAHDYLGVGYYDGNYWTQKFGR